MWQRKQPEDEGRQEASRRSRERRYSGIHRFNLPLEGVPLDGINVYVLEGDRGHIMIDTGWDSRGVFEKLRADFASVGLDLADVATIVATHVHADHYGLAARVKELSGAQLVMHRADGDLVDSWYRNSGPALDTAAGWMRSHGIPSNDLPGMKGYYMAMIRRVGVTEPDRLVEDGDVISNGSFELTVISTPGHSPGHICLYEAGQRILFTGDQVLPGITSHVGLYPESRGSPLGDYLGSLARLTAFDVDMAFPAHGEPFADFAERLRELGAHHEERMAEILHVLDSEPHTAYDIAGRITWMKEIGGRAFDELAVVDRRMAVMETASHVQVLIDQGRAIQLRTDELVEYAAAKANA